MFDTGFSELRKFLCPASQILLFCLTKTKGCTASNLNKQFKSQHKRVH